MFGTQEISQKKPRRSVIAIVLLSIGLICVSYEACVMYIEKQAIEKKWSKAESNLKDTELLLEENKRERKQDNAVHANQLAHVQTELQHQVESFAKQASLCVGVRKKIGLTE